MLFFISYIGFLREAQHNQWSNWGPNVLLKGYKGMEVNYSLFPPTLSQSARGFIPHRTTLLLYFLGYHTLFLLSTLNETQSVKQIFCCNVLNVSGYCSQRWGLSPWLVWMSPGCSLTAPVINDDRLRSRSFITWRGSNLSISLNQCKKAKRKELVKLFLAIKSLGVVTNSAHMPCYLFWIVCELQIADSFPRNRFLCFHFVLSSFITSSIILLCGLFKWSKNKEDTDVRHAILMFLNHP